MYKILGLKNGRNAETCQHFTHLMPTSCIYIYIYIFQVVVNFNNIQYDGLQHIRIEGLTYNVEISKKKLQILSCALKHTRLYPAVRIHHIGYYKTTINNRQQKCSAIICQSYVSESMSSLGLKSFLQHQHKTIMLANKTGILLQNKRIPSKHG